MQSTLADRVFDELRNKILSLALPPGTKLSETDVAMRLDVSRQPVREAFKRLSRLGFLIIRPQSGTTVSLISEDSVLRARFIRTALEVKTCKTACERISQDGLSALNDLIAQQNAALHAADKNRFFTLDDAFHREICIQSGVSYVWDMIQDSKAHMDRIRMLAFTAEIQQMAIDEHKAIYTAIAQDRPEAAEHIMTQHLTRILTSIAEVKSQDHRWFTETAQ